MKEICSDWEQASKRAGQVATGYVYSMAYRVKLSLPAHCNRPTRLPVLLILAETPRTHTGLGLRCSETGNEASRQLTILLTNQTYRLAVELGSIGTETPTVANIINTNTQKKVVVQTQNKINNLQNNPMNQNNAIKRKNNQKTRDRKRIVYV